MRQLIGSNGNDDLLNTVCKLYSQHSSIEVKSLYVEGLRKSWNDYLKASPMNIELAKIIPSNQWLLETFQYGALFIHSPNKVRSSKARESFKKICLDKNLRVEALFFLNTVMRTLYSKASNIATLVQNDYAQWINDKKVPVPEVMWQQNLFQWNPTVKKEERFSDNDSEPQFGVAYNVEIQ